MRVIVETPKWSFTKYHTVGGRIEKEFLSPLPNLFNYGHIPGTKAADGMEQDVLILGPRLAPGPQDAIEAGVVSIIDEGVADDKVIASHDGRVNALDRMMISVFFSVYMPYKAMRYLLIQGKTAKFRYGGIIIYRHH
jgi:inorganic pyrophosphatase